MEYHKTLIHGPAYAIIMPVDKNGDGPCDVIDANFVYWEVWDQVCNVICRCNDKHDAKRIAELINLDDEWPHAW